MSTPSQQFAAPPANTQSATGPRSESIVAAGDFIRPTEQSSYADLQAELLSELAPVGILETTLVDEIRRATWRLRRCGQVEANLVIELNDGRGFIFDPMETPNVDIEKAQKSVDRSRAQAHRLLHKCTAELRKLQTERQLRNESFDAGTDLSHFGLCDWSSISKHLDRQFMADYRRDKHKGVAEIDAILSTPIRPPAQSGSFCKTPRNAQCPCNSGQKYKRCCGKNAPPMLHAA